MGGQPIVNIKHMFVSPDSESLLIQDIASALPTEISSQIFDMRIELWNILRGLVYTQFNVLNNNNMLDPSMTHED